MSSLAVSGAHYVGCFKQFNLNSVPLSAREVKNEQDSLRNEGPIISLLRDRPPLNKLEALLQEEERPSSHKIQEEAQKVIPEEGLPFAELSNSELAPAIQSISVSDSEDHNN